MNSAIASTIKGRPAFMAVGLCAVVLGALAFLIARGVSGGSSPAVADFGPNPPENPAISGDWPDFSGKVLHWQNYSSSFVAGGPDNANGEEIRGDIWVQVGPDNKPLALRGMFTYADGSFHQDYLYMNGRGSVVYDEPVQGPGEDSAPSCRIDSILNDQTFNELVDTGEPAFVDYARVASAGFVRSDIAPAGVAALEPAQRAAGTLVGDSGVSEVWVKQSALESGAKLIDLIQVDGEGRLVAETHTGEGPDGSELFSYRRAFSQIEIFDGRDAAIQSVFDSETLSEACSA